MLASALAAPSTDNSVPKRTPLILFWAFCTLLWSLFTPPHKTFPARISIFQPLWGIRMYTHESTWTQDLLLFLSTHSVYTYWTGIWHFPTPNILKWIDISNPVTLIYVETFGLLAICGGLAGGIVYRGHLMKAKSELRENLREQRIDEQLLPPLLIPSRTSHARLFPERHAFSYSYLFVGIPVGMKGRINNTLSVDGPGQRGRAWFHVSCADYLARGGSHLGLAEKLKRYLLTQGVTDRDYSFAYLVTAPKLFGYSFNPVSFWYLYDSDAVLKFMVLEVNNTFDERRMYLLRGEGGKYLNGSAVPRSQSVDTMPESPGKLTFSETWEKDFHVSPFNSRKGSYSLRAMDPLAAYEESGHVCIDNTIVLRSSKDSAKIFARVKSEGKPREATKIESLELYRFIASWWWVGLATFPRIVWEAQKLFFRRKLHVWYRPEVAESSIGRMYTDDERRLECFFHAFLREVVEQSKDPLKVKYLPAHAAGEENVLYSPGFTYEEDQKRTLTLEVLSPAFYSRFVHYAHAKEAFDRESLTTDEKNRTLAIKNAKLLPLLLSALRDYKPRKPRQQNFLEQVRWSCLRRLRCPPSSPIYPHGGTQDNEYEITDIRTFHDSELDKFVKKRCDDASVYRRIVTTLFLAQRFALGIPALISAIDWLLRLSCILMTLYYSDLWKDVDIVRPRELAPKPISFEDANTFAALVVLANMVHLWSLIKG